MTGNTAEQRLAELQRQLGCLSMEFASLETAIGCALAFLVNENDARIGHIFVTELSLKARLKAFKALYLERAPSGFDKDLLDSFLSQVQQVEDERNRLIHSVYLPGPVGSLFATRHKPTVKKHFHVQYEILTPNEVAALADRAKSLPERLDQLMIQFKGYDHPYLGKFYSILYRDPNDSAP